MRIAIHDFGGHPFVFELSRQLAHQGYNVGHFFFADYPGPKGDARHRPGDSPRLSIHPLTVGKTYRTDKLFTRWTVNRQYADVAAKAIEAFAPDIVLSGNTPTEVQGRLMRASVRSDAKFVFWVQDLYGLAVSTFLRKKWLGFGAAIGAWYRRQETQMLKASNSVVLISSNFAEELDDLGRDAPPTHVIPNWAPLADIPVRPRNNSWSRQHGLANKIVLLYSGTLGLKHDPMALVALADAFKDDPEVVILVTAEGAGKRALAAHLADQPRSNIRLLGLQPMEEFPDVLASADILVGLLEQDAGRFSVPSKVLSYFCSGRPVVLSAPLENLSAHVVREAGAGITVPAGDVDQLIEAVKRLRADEALRAELGDNGRRYATANFEIAAVAARFQSVFEAALPATPEAAPEVQVA